MDKPLQAKHAGCMIGSGLGDAIGELAFRFSTRSRLLAAIEAADILHYTDDTAMAIGVAQSLAKQHGIDPEHLGQTLHRNFTREPWRGYALGPPTIFALVEETGMAYSDAAKTLFGNQGSFGNGAAMRVAPVGLFFADSSALYQQACASARVTHAHPLAQDGAALQALAVARALRLDPQQPFPHETFLTEALAFTKTAQMQAKLRQIAELLQADATCRDAAAALGKSVAIHESLPFAWYAFLKHPQSFAECLFCATLNGGDRDTLGAMSGAIAGAYLGLQVIEPAWQNKLENRNLLEELACALLP